MKPIRPLSIFAFALGLPLAFANVSFGIELPFRLSRYQPKAEAAAPAPLPKKPEPATATPPLKPAPATSEPKYTRPAQPAQSTNITPPLAVAGDNDGDCADCEPFYRDRPYGKKKMREGVIINNHNNEPNWYRYYRCEHYGHYPTQWSAWPDGWLKCRGPVVDPHPHDVEGIVGRHKTGKKPGANTNRDSRDGDRLEPAPKPPEPDTLNLPKSKQTDSADEPKKKT